MKKPIKVLMAKPGLDGHDRGVKIIARALSEAVMEVVYTGRHQTPAQIVRDAAENKVDLVGLSILSGAHITLVREVLALMRDEGIGDVPLFLGGTIPDADLPELRLMGVAEVFGPGMSMNEIVKLVTKQVMSRRAAA